MRNKAAVVLLGAALGVGSAADYPQKNLDNGKIKLTVALPDPAKGYYRGTRFDWSGEIESLEYQGHSYYSPWFVRIDPATTDFGYDGANVIVGRNSAVMGPVEEFSDVGFNDAKPGGTFLKIGVGALRKPGDGRYDHYHIYDIANPGKWSVRSGKDFIEFTQDLSDAASGYGYVYRKTIRLVKGKPEFTLEHSLKNTGQKAIVSRVYDHNFLRLDRQGPGPGLVITVPFQIQTARPPNKELAEVRGNQIEYLKPLEGKDVVSMQVRGFGTTDKDYDIRVENRQTGLGMHVTGDRPLSNVSLWSISSVTALEPYIAIDVAPGGEFTWNLKYDYFTGGAK